MVSHTLQLYNKLAVTRSNLKRKNFSKMLPHYNRTNRLSLPRYESLYEPSYIRHWYVYVPIIHKVQVLLESSRSRHINSVLPENRVCPYPLKSIRRSSSSLYASFGRDPVSPNHKNSSHQKLICWRGSPLIPSLVSATWKGVHLKKGLLNPKVLLKELHLIKGFLVEGTDKGVSSDEEGSGNHRMSFLVMTFKGSLGWIGYGIGLRIA